jgi:hypothetical protein
MKKYKIISGVILIMILLLALGSFNLPGCRRQRQTWKSSTIGLDRRITWTGDGVAPKVWETRTKVFTDEAGKIRFFDEQGNTVILMGNVCIEVVEK